MSKKKALKDSAFQISFSKQNERQIAEDNRLTLEMLRVNATEKQRVMNQIWMMDQDTLCDYFTTYRLFPQSIFTLRDLLDSKDLKLIKNDGKIYFGQVDRKKRSGKGICVYKQGKIYEGEFADNQRNGIGVEIYTNGNLYLGEFYNNKKHGKGQFFWFSLNTKMKELAPKLVEYYDGQWWGGLPDGEGIHQKTNGDFYTGFFKNGLKHGMGSQRFGNQDHYKGEYVNGLPEGFGEYEWSDGCTYKGDFKQGLRSGYGLWHLNEKQSTQKYQGHYHMDKKSGYGVYEWENGWIYKGNFQNDYRNGYGELYDVNVCTYKGFWDNGETSQYEKPIANVSSKTTLNRRSRAESQNPQYKYSQTVDLNQQFTKINFEPKLTLRPQFTIKKRPQSFTNLQKEKAKSTGRKKVSPSKSTVGTSVSRPLFKMDSHMYVPGLHNSRQRR